jgi:transposase
MERQKLTSEREARLEKIIDLRNSQGKTQREIADELFFHIETIKRDFSYLKTQGLELQPRQYNKETTINVQNRRDKVEALWNKEKTQKEIAEILGTPITTISQDLERMRQQGIDIKRKITRKKSPDKTKTRRKLVEKLRETHTAKEIAEMTGESIHRIKKDYRVLNKQAEMEAQKKADEDKELVRRKRVAKKLRQGETVEEIAQTEGLSIGKINADKFIIENQIQDPKVVYEYIAKRLKK